MIILVEFEIIYQARPDEKNTKNKIKEKLK